MSELTKIEQDSNYQELVRRRSSLGWMLSLIMLVIYFGFILLVAYAPKFLGTPIGTGVTTIGIPIGLAVIVLAFALTVLASVFLLVAIYGALFAMAGAASG